MSNSDFPISDTAGTLSTTTDSTSLIPKLDKILAKAKLDNLKVAKKYEVTITDNSFMKRVPGFSFRKGGIKENEVTSFSPFSEEFRNSFAPSMFIEDISSANINSFSSIQSPNTYYTSVDSANYNQFPFLVESTHVSSALNKQLTDIQLYMSRHRNKFFNSCNIKASVTHFDTNSYFSKMSSNQDHFVVNFKYLKNISNKYIYTTYSSFISLLLKVYTSSEEISCPGRTTNGSNTKQFQKIFSILPPNTPVINSENMENRLFLRLINFWEKIPGLTCFSFLYYTSNTYKTLKDFRIIHIWVNEDLDVDSIKIPIYWNYGIPNYIMNMTLSKHGIYTTPTGIQSIKLKINDKIVTKIINGNLFSGDFINLPNFYSMPYDISQSGIITYIHQGVDLYKLGIVKNTTFSGNLWKLDDRIKDIPFAKDVANLFINKNKNKNDLPTDSSKLRKSILNHITDAGILPQIEEEIVTAVKDQIFTQARQIDPTFNVNKPHTDKEVTGYLAGAKFFGSSIYVN